VAESGRCGDRGHVEDFIYLMRYAVNTPDPSMQVERVVLSEKGVGSKKPTINETKMLLSRKSWLNETILSVSGAGVPQEGAGMDIVFR
jgi:hypothetical protein